MEVYLCVREARRRFAEIVNKAAFGDHRVVIVRNQVEVAAVVSLDDHEFLRRYRPGQESSPSVSALEQDLRELADDEERLARKEEWAQRAGAPDSPELVAERERLSAERAWLNLLMSMRKRLPAARA